MTRNRLEMLTEAERLEMEKPRSNTRRALGGLMPRKSHHIGSNLVNKIDECVASNYPKIYVSIVKARKVDEAGGGASIKSGHQCAPIDGPFWAQVPIRAFCLCVTTLLNGSRGDQPPN